MATFRNFSIYSDSGKRITYAKSGSIDSSANGELVIGDGQVLGRSAGVPTAKATIEVGIDVEGNSGWISFLQSMAQASSTKPMKMTFGIVDGKILAADMWCESANAKASMAQGTTDGDISLIGRFPTSTG